MYLHYKSSEYWKWIQRSRWHYVITGLTHLVCPESTPHIELFPFVRDVSHPIFLVPESLPPALPPCKLGLHPHTGHNIKGVSRRRLRRNSLTHQHRLQMRKWSQSACFQVPQNYQSRMWCKSATLTPWCMLPKGWSWPSTRANLGWNSQKPKHLVEHHDL